MEDMVGGVNFVLMGARFGRWTALSRTRTEGGTIQEKFIARPTF